MRRPLRRNAIEQNTQRLRLQAPGQPERQNLLGFPTVERGTLGLAGVDTQLAERDVLVRRQIELGQRIVRLREKSGAERRIGDGAFEHGLYGFIRHVVCV